MSQGKSNTKYLFTHLVKTDIMRRYQGSVLGLLWALLVPLIMLTIYTFIFSEIFSAKWNVNTGNKFEFALMLFCGLSLYNMFADVLGRSVGLIEQNQNYVKKVVFPIEILPPVITISALFNCSISFLILIVANTIINTGLYITVLQAPLILLPHIVFCMGIAYFFSAISVYLKDMVNLVGIITTVGMYITPVFFPLSAVPKSFQLIMMLNPMTYTIENMRNVIIYGRGTDLGYFAISAGTALVLFLLGRWIFMRAKIGFADLL